jgi:hypothetical protein
MIPENKSQDKAISNRLVRLDKLFFQHSGPTNRYGSITSVV